MHAPFYHVMQLQPSVLPAHNGNVPIGRLCLRYHIYKDAYSPTFREKLPCCRDYKNTKDPFAVTAKHRTTIVGHASQIMSIYST